MAEAKFACSDGGSGALEVNIGIGISEIYMLKWGAVFELRRN